jgi:hypothetical protein
VGSREHLEPVLQSHEATHKRQYRNCAGLGKCTSNRSRRSRRSSPALLTRHLIAEQLSVQANLSKQTVGDSWYLVTVIMTGRF